jgi:mono/diheme cytochrome c family protein
MRFLKMTVFILTLLMSIIALSAFAQDGGDPERGATLYGKYCAMCHGQDGGGRIGANLEDFPGIRADAAMASIISDGIPGSTMPAWSIAKGGPLTDEDISDITGYLLGVLNGTTPVSPAPTYQPPAIPTLPGFDGDPSIGAIVFNENCIVCHGDSGQGFLGKTLAQNWPGNQPEAYLTDVIARGVRGTLMPAWGEAYGGPLAESEIMNVSAYLLSLSPAAGLPAGEAAGEGPLSVTASLLIFGLLGLVLVIGAIVYYRRSGES